MAPQEGGAASARGAEAEQRLPKQGGASVMKWDVGSHLHMATKFNQAATSSPYLLPSAERNVGGNLPLPLKQLDTE